MAIVPILPLPKEEEGASSQIVKPLKQEEEEAMMVMVTWYPLMAGSLGRPVPHLLHH